MKATSYTQLNTYMVDGNDLAIYWNEEAHTPHEGETEPYWTYDHCQAFASDDRSALIEKIMATMYPTMGAEIAAISNGGRQAEDHQAFRAKAKALADGWLKEKGK
jgi:hypothetical protein